ncbi:hypothetical protein VSVS05_04378 (plasmid) [Vibrio scophthalmi]|uniref:Uncharacterized protein n=1 Tax=Vibrio scophthalmi TaxID=45658 RepID=A0A1C7FIX8_9VIBR|nr:hypothetical protein VSVS05_04378 [Vibrio scophthalmi]
MDGALGAIIELKTLNLFKVLLILKLEQHK